MYVVNIPEILAELRALGADEDIFVTRFGIPRRTWGRLRRGEYQPRQDTARRIAHAMRVLRAERLGKPNDGGGTDDDSGEKACAPYEMTRLSQ